MDKDKENIVLQDNQETKADAGNSTSTKQRKNVEIPEKEETNTPATDTNAAGAAAAAGAGKADPSAATTQTVSAPADLPAAGTDNENFMPGAMEGTDYSSTAYDEGYNANGTADADYLVGGTGARPVDKLAGLRAQHAAQSEDYNKEDAAHTQTKNINGSTVTSDDRYTGNEKPDKEKTFEQLVDEAAMAKARMYNSAGRSPYMDEIDEVRKPTDEEKEADKDVTMSYEQMYKLIDDLSAKKQKELETSEERMKREKQDKMWAGISDGISSLANLHWTSQYAPNIINDDTIQSGKMQERYDKYRAERDKLQDRIRELAALRLQAVAGKRDNIRGTRKNRLQELIDADKVWQNNRLTTGRIAGYNSGNYWRQQNYNLAKEKFGYDKMNDEEQKAFDKWYKTQRLNLEGVRAAKSGGGGNRATYKFNGKVYETKADRDIDVYKEAQRLGIPTSTVVGGKKNSDQVAAEVEQAIASRSQRSGGSGSRGSGSRGNGSRGNGGSSSTSTLLKNAKKK